MASSAPVIFSTGKPLRRKPPPLPLLVVPGNIEKLLAPPQLSLDPTAAPARPQLSLDPTTAPARPQLSLDPTAGPVMRPQLSAIAEALSLALPLLLLPGWLHQPQSTGLPLLLLLARLSIADLGVTSGVSPVPKDVEDLDADEWKAVAAAGMIEPLDILGEGAGGQVMRCRLKLGLTVFALKTIVTTDPLEQRQVVRELQYSLLCMLPFIVRYYGAFVNEQDSTICIAMELMGGRLLDAIYRRVEQKGGRVGERVLGRVAILVLTALLYLHDRKIVHRDIKPLNILLNGEGEVKVCDFGVLGEVINLLAKTWTGTSWYMAPERIVGQPYTVTSDVWLLGLSLLEVAKGRFPFSTKEHDDGGMTLPLMPLEIVKEVVDFTPLLDDEEGIVWLKGFKLFIEYALQKNPSERPGPKQLLAEHPWIQKQKDKKVDMQAFVRKCWE